MRIVCPLCGSGNAERLVLTWSRGLSRHRTKTFGIGSFFAFANPLNNGIVGLAALALTPLVLALWPILTFLRLGLLAAYSWGTSQSALSYEAKPPFRFPAAKAALAAGYTFFVLPSTVVGMMHLPPARENIGVLLSALAGGAAAWLAAHLGALYNRRVWAPREALWQRSFLCKRCGANFAVPEFDPEGIQPVRSDRKGALLPLAGDPAGREAAMAKAATDDARLRKNA